MFHSPMSSPMMTRMLGFAGGAWASADVPSTKVAMTAEAAPASLLFLIVYLASLEQA